MRSPVTRSNESATSVNDGGSEVGRTPLPRSKTTTRVAPGPSGSTTTMPVSLSSPLGRSVIGTSATSAISISIVASVPGKPMPAARRTVLRAPSQPTR